MDVTTLKERAARQEREGDLANAIATYREILDQLDDARSITRELPLIAKLGDLLAQTGDVAAAVATYEQAAAYYMEHGSAKSISVLCLKVLRADHSQTDVYFRFAQGLFEHGHVEAAREVLVDYAERAKLEKTLTRLKDLVTQPQEKVRHHLEQLFAKVEQRARPPSPTPAPSDAPSAVHEMEELDEEEPAEDVEEEEIEEEPEDEEIEEELEAEGGEVEQAEVGAAPSLVTSDITLPADGEAEVDLARVPPSSEAEAEPAAAEEIPSPDDEATAAAAPMSESEPESVERAPEPAPVDAESEREPVAIAKPEPVEVGYRAASEVAPPAPAKPPDEPVTTPARGRGRDVLFSGLDYRAEKARPAWLWPAVAAVAVVVSVGAVAMLVTGNGSEPDEGGVAEQESPSPASAVGTELGDTVADTLALPVAAVDSVPIEADAGDTAFGAAGQPILPDADAGGQEVAPPAVAQADTVTRQPPRIITRPERADRVLVVEGLQIESVEDLPSGTGGYRVVQVLASGEGLAMSVVPIDRAGPVVGGGALRVSPLRGDSAIGTIRFGDQVVTARAALSPSVLEGLLRQLVEVERP